MARQVVSRSQRRMEKRQALVLLVLVLGVSLVSFTLGVMVGRGGSRQETAGSMVEVPARGSVVRGKVPETGAERPPSREKLTFYDSLPKGEPSPIGSGINLPPEQASPDDGKKAAANAPRTNGSATPEEEVVEAVKASPPPALPDEQGAYAVQVASFRGAEDARKLKERLAGKNYAAFVEAADLQEKGTWHRVFVGPFGTAETARKTVSRLQVEEKLDGLVRKR